MKRFPVEELSDQLVECARSRSALVLRAPTGSGKSTRIPPLLLDCIEQGVIWVIQPRRLAARSLAQWVAQERGEELGQTVGYRVRFDSRVGPNTRLIFMTPGVALRMLQEPAALDKVCHVLFDEFHERGAETDALAGLIAAKFRQGGPVPWILSATIDLGEWTRWLGPWGPVVALEAKGRLHPVSIRHQAPSAPRLAASVCQAITQQIRAGAQGDILAFLPGIGDIRHCQSLLEESALRSPDGRSVRVLPLHGDIEPAQQDQALRPAPNGTIHVILATNVAETSLTLPGVVHVVDSGYVRMARFDARRGLNTLYTVRASAKSADQRAGRAGRVQPGTCLRLWLEQDLSPLEEPPEIERIDLAGLWLQLSCSGFPVQNLPWPTPPPQERLAAAIALLQSLGALSDGGTPTTMGQKMCRLPVAPRTARVLLEAESLGNTTQAVRWAADLESNGPEDARRLEQRLRGALRENHRAVPLGRLLLPAFGDRLATASGDGRVRLADDRWAQTDQKMADGQLVIALEVQELAGSTKGPLLALRDHVPIETAWVAEAFGERCTEAIEVVWDPRTRRVAGRRTTRLNGQILTFRTLDDNAIPRPRAEEILAEAVRCGDIRWQWGEEEEQWCLRTRLVAEAFPEKAMNRLLEEDLELVRAALVEGCLAAAGVEQKAVLPLLKEVQGQEQVAWIEKMAPTTLGLSSGRRAKVQYSPTSPALVSARIGDFIGVTQASVRIGQGRIPLLFEILAPNHRPVQRTSDLDGFWSRSYPEIRKDLARRYPRHPWP